MTGKKFALIFILLIYAACASEQTKYTVAAAIIQDPKAIVSEDKENPIKIPQLTYSELLNYDTNAFEEEIYHGFFYPIRVFLNTPDFFHQKIKNQKVLMVTTGESDERLLLLFPDDKTSFMRELTSKYERKEFIYKPLGVVLTKYPLLQLINVTN